MMNLRGIDLNLVVALEALLAERSVTRAARRVGLSQPAMSHALAKLRDILDDPLLVRVGRTMVLTERAEALAAKVDGAIHGMEELFAGPPAFDPAASTRRFYIAASDYVQFVMLPPLEALLRREAPGVSIVVKPIGRPAVAGALRAGDIDLALGLLAGDSEPDIHRVELIRDRFVGMARKGHPRVRRSMSRAAYAELPHLLVSPGGEAAGLVDSAMAEYGLQRKVVMSVPQFLVAPHIIVQSDLVVTIAALVARPFARILPLRIFEPPIELRSIVLGACWHRRTHEEPAHQWLRAAFEYATAGRLSHK